MKISFSEGLDSTAVAKEADRWSAADLMVRLWDKDPTVWFDPPRDEISDRLGWLDLPKTAQRHLDDLYGNPNDNDQEHENELENACGHGSDP